MNLFLTTSFETIDKELASILKSQDKLENRNKNIDVTIFNKGYENSFCQLLVSSRMAALLIPQHDLQHAAGKSQHIKMNKTKYNKKLWFHTVKLFMEKSNILYWRVFLCSEFLRIGRLSLKKKKMLRLVFDRKIFFTNWWMVDEVTNKNLKPLWLREKAPPFSRYPVPVLQIVLKYYLGKKKY